MQSLALPRINMLSSPIASVPKETMQAKVSNQNCTYYNRKHRQLFSQLLQQVVAFRRRNTAHRVPRDENQIDDRGWRYVHKRDQGLLKQESTLCIAQQQLTLMHLRDRTRKATQCNKSAKPLARSFTTMSRWCLTCQLSLRSSPCLKVFQFWRITGLKQ